MLVDDPFSRFQTNFYQEFKSSLDFIYISICMLLLSVSLAGNVTLSSLNIRWIKRIK